MGEQAHIFSSSSSSSSFFLLLSASVYHHHQVSLPSCAPLPSIPCGCVYLSMSCLRNTKLREGTKVSSSKIDYELINLGKEKKNKKEKKTREIRHHLLSIALDLAINIHARIFFLPLLVIVWSLHVESIDE